MRRFRQLQEARSREGDAVPRLIQICASQNDLFGLAGDGAVYQYNFNSNSWTQLGGEWRDQGGSPRADDRPNPKAVSATPSRRR